MISISPKNSSVPWLFLLFIIAAYVNIGAFDKLNKRPQGPHQWAQCDRASVALNFYQESMDIFHPRVHNKINGSGITGLEFPVVNFLVAVAYKIFGFHEFIYRLIVALFFFTGQFFALKIAREYIRNGFLAILTVLLFTFSPVLVFYTFNFIPDMVSLGLAMIAWYFFIQFRKGKGVHYRRWLQFVLVFSCLIKITIVLVVGTMVFLWYLEKRKKEQNPWSALTSKEMLGWTGLTLLPVILWYVYASWLNTSYRAGFFLLHPKPIHSVNNFIETLRTVWTEHGLQYYPVPVYMLILTVFLLMVFMKTKTEPFLRRVVLLLFLMFTVFFIVMGPQLIDHDYYIITFLPFFFFSFVLIVNWLERTILMKTWTIIPALIAFVFLTNYSMIQSKKDLRSRYNPESWQYGNKVMNRYFELESALRTSGIKREDRVVSYQDLTSNSSLYLMNQYGMTLAEKDSQVVQRPVFQSVKFAILNEQVTEQTVFLQPYLGKLILSKDGIWVYAWNPEKRESQ